MEFIKESFDKKSNKYIFEYNVTKEEKESIEKFCKDNNTTIDEYVEKMFQWIVNNPKEFSKWIKQNREDKCDKGIIGNPKFKINDTVGFYIKPYKKDYEIFCIGKIEIVDAYGTFEQNEEPSYDILVEDFDLREEWIF